MSNLNDNFWKWFGDSTTVDAEGNPIVFYHGTKQRFSTFKTKYDDKLVFFAYDKKFALDWGGNRSKDQDQIADDIYNNIKDKRNAIAKWYQNKYGSSDTWSEEIWKEYKHILNRIETQAYHKADIDTKIMPVYIKAHKIFVPERDYELVLDDIIAYYDFPTSAPDNSKEIAELEQKRNDIYTIMRKEGRTPKDMTDVEYDELEELDDKIATLKKEQNAVKYFEENDLARIKKGAWIYFEHKEIIDKIFDELGYDAIQLSERVGEPPTTLAVREGTGQIKSIYNNGEWSNSNNIYETKDINDEFKKYFTESIEEIAQDAYATQSAYTIRDLIKNKPRDYRIVYDDNIKWYIIGDARRYIYNQLMQAAMKVGLYATEGLENEDDVTDYIDHEIGNARGYLAWLYFSPKDNKLLDKDRSDDLYLCKFIYDFGVIYLEYTVDPDKVPLFTLLGEPNKVEYLDEDNKMNEKLIKHRIVPKDIKSEYDEMEDETGMNKVDESIEVGKTYKLKKINSDLIHNDVADYEVLKEQGNLVLCKNKETDEKFVFQKDMLVDPEKSDEIYSDIAIQQVDEEASFAQLGTAPTPPIAQVTVDGIPVAGKSVKRAKKKRKIEEAEEFKSNNEFITSAQVTKEGDEYIVKFYNNDQIIAEGVMDNHGVWAVKPHPTKEVYAQEELDYDGTLLDSWQEFVHSSDFKTLTYNIADRILVETDIPQLIEKLNAVIDEALS